MTDEDSNSKRKKNQRDTNKRTLRSQLAKHTNWIKWAVEQKDPDNKVLVTRRMPFACYLRQRYTKGEMVCGVFTMLQNFLQGQTPPESSNPGFSSLGFTFLNLPIAVYTWHRTSSRNSLACGLMYSFRRIKARDIWCRQWENVSYRRKRSFPHKEKKTNKSHQH